MLRRKIFFFLYTAVCLGGMACKKETKIEKVTDDGYFGRAGNIINDNASLSSFNYFLRGYPGQLVDTLLQPGPYTVMAPANTAFSIQISQFTYDTVSLRNALAMPYFVLNGQLPLKQLPVGLNQELTTMTGNKIWVSKWANGSDTVITVNGARVSTVDAPVTNGLLNVLNRTYLAYAGNDCTAPVFNRYNLSFFAAALQRCHWDDSLRSGGPYTVLAPDNTAFINRGFPNMDSVLHTSIDTLARLVKAHVLKNRKFFYDFEMDRVTNDTLYYSLNNDLVRTVLITDTRFTTYDPLAKRIVFLGKNDVYSAPTRFDLYSLAYPCGNGTVLTIDKVLKQ
jgi:uncharacterized surface protein with fasciclin (FAS1) repeats